MVFDAQDNLWIASGGGINEFNNLGVELSPVSGFINNGISSITAVAVDSSDNVWIGNANTSQPSLFSELTNPGGELIVNSGPALNGDGLMNLPQLAADGKGDVWGISSTNGFNNPCEVPPYGGQGTILIPTCYQGSNSNGLNYILIGTNPQGLAFDGAGGLWIAGPGGGVTLRDAMGNYSVVSTSIPVPVLNAGSLRAAVDGSGNVWVLLANNVVVEHIGAATPVVTPLALGLKNGKLAAKP
jgi:ligand-binding sensor domain-containing protein